MANSRRTDFCTAQYDHYPVQHAGYASNSDFLNHCITSFLKRLCAPDGLNLESMLYQVCAGISAWVESAPSSIFETVPIA